MKKQYFRPSMRVVEIKNTCQILAGSVTSINSGDGFIYGGGSGGYARTPMLDEIDELEQ